MAERQAYIGRVRSLARQCCETWVRAGQNWKTAEEQRLKMLQGSGHE